MNVSLVLGDPYEDGHGRHKTIHIESNRSAKHMQKSYVKGTALVGVDLAEDLCSDYQSRCIDVTDLKKFIALGFNTGYTLDEETGGEVVLDIDTFVQIYLFTVKLGDPKFTFKIINNKEVIRIGGYGLFDG